MVLNLICGKEFAYCLNVLRQVWRGERAGALISAELVETASSCIVAVTVLIVSTVPSDWSLIHFLSICFPSHLVPLLLSNTK